MNPSNPLAVDHRSFPERAVVASAASAFALMLLFAPDGKAAPDEQPVSQSQQKVAADQQKLLKSAADSSIYPKPENMLVNTDPEPDLNTGFVSLYNGKNLDGWVQRGAKNKYEAKGDVIEGT